jgi:hypothetical protein
MWRKSTVNMVKIPSLDEPPKRGGNPMCETLYLIVRHRLAQPTFKNTWKGKSDSLLTCITTTPEVAKSCSEGYKWLDLAAAKGSETSKKLMAVLENKMTPVQIAEGQKLARDFKPRRASAFGKFYTPENFTTNGAMQISSPMK